jgi:hypothetical protein
MKIKIQIVDVSTGEKKKEVSWRIPLKWLNPFRFRKPSLPIEDKPRIEDKKEEDEQPEGWIHPPFP